MSNMICAFVYLLIVVTSLIFLDGAMAFGPVTFSSFAAHSQNSAHGLRHVSIVRKASEQNHDDVSSDDTERDERSEKSSDEEFTLEEIARIEEKASRRVMSRLLLPEKIGKAINFAGWFFVASSIALNAFGYSYIKREEGYGVYIDTLDNRAFVMETRKSMKEMQKPPP